MPTTYAQRPSTVQKAAAPNAASVLDSSPQSESLQRKADMANNAAQRAEAPRPNNTGMPDNLKSGIESLSGFSMDSVRVHYNSSKPATVQALAYTQGTDIHVAPGQEKHLPHEAWHVAQQMAGRVSPTTNINGMAVNDNAALEHEADVMGEKATVQRKKNNPFFNEPHQNKKICCTIQNMAANSYFLDNSSYPCISNSDKPKLKSGSKILRSSLIIKMPHINKLYDTQDGARNAAYITAKDEAGKFVNYQKIQSKVQFGLNRTGVSGPETLDIYWDKNNKKYIGFGYAFHSTDDSNQLSTDDDLSPGRTTQHYHAIKHEETYKKNFETNGYTEEIGNVKHYLIKPNGL